MEWQLINFATLDAWMPEQPENGIVPGLIEPDVEPGAAQHSRRHAGTRCVRGGEASMNGNANV